MRVARSKATWQRLLNLTGPTARKYLQLSGRTWTDPAAGHARGAALAGLVPVGPAQDAPRHAADPAEPSDPAELEMLQPANCCRGGTPRRTCSAKAEPRARPFPECARPRRSHARAPGTCQPSSTPRHASPCCGRQTWPKQSISKINYGFSAFCSTGADSAAGDGPFVAEVHSALQARVAGVLAHERVERVQSWAKAFCSRRANCSAACSPEDGFLPGFPEVNQEQLMAFGITNAGGALPGCIHSLSS